MTVLSIQVQTHFRWWVNPLIGGAAALVRVLGVIRCAFPWLLALMMRAIKWAIVRHGVRVTLARAS